VFGFRPWLDRRAGARFAQRVIDAYEEGFIDEKEIAEGRKAVFRKKHRHFQSEFSRGWDRRWMQQGAEDARRGRCRSHLFQVQHYDIGFSEALAERARYGWTNAALEVERQKLWWSTGRSQ